MISSTGRIRLFVAVFGVVTVAALLVIHAVTFLLLPPLDIRIERVVLVPPGASLRGAADRLEEAGIVGDAGTFVFLSKLLARERQVKAGEYALHTQMRPLEVLEQLTAGKVIQYEVTIPEGFTLEQIAELLDQRGLVSYDAFTDIALDPAYVASLNLEGNSLEGYLFPQTYYFSRTVDASGVVQKMVDTFRAEFTPELVSRAAEIGFSIREAVTLASIIEKETSKDSERPLVSAVFHNRLRSRMMLQSDPTVIYGLTGFDGNLTRKDLKAPSPYNTYVISGLPPGPIANPGRDSLRAALYPAEADYLFFVSKNDGSHIFSQSLKQHNEAVDQFQRKRQKRGM